MRAAPSQGLRQVPAVVADTSPVARIGAIPWFFSNVLALLVTVASIAGIFVPAIYANEAATWAAQGVGQDIVSLALGVPVLVVSAYLARKGSMRASLVSVGVLAYFSYSYLMYAYCITFGPMFPVYLAALATSFYLLIGAVVNMDAARVRHAFGPASPTRLAGWFLVVLPCLFLLMEGSAIASALAAGTIPKTAAEVGLRVDPVHIQDLGLFLPGMFLVGVLLLRRQPLGYLLAAPLLVSLIVLGVAIMGMGAVMAARDIPVGPQMFIAIGASNLVALFIVSRLLASIRTKPGCCGNCAGCGKSEGEAT